MGETKFRELLQDLEKRLSVIEAEILVYESKISYQILKKSPTFFMAGLAKKKDIDYSDCKTPEDLVGNEAHLIRIENEKKVLQGTITRLNEDKIRLQRYATNGTTLELAQSNLADVNQLLRRLYQRLEMLSKARELEKYVTAKIIEGKNSSGTGLWYALAKLTNGGALKKLISQVEYESLNLGTSSAEEALSICDGELISYEYARCKEEMAISVCQEEEKAKTMSKQLEPSIQMAMEQSQVGTLEDNGINLTHHL